MEADVGSPPYPGSAPRALKRAFTIVEYDGPMRSLSEDGDASMHSSSQSQEECLTPPTSRPVLPACSPMDPPLMPPPWKRPARSISSISASSLATPRSPTRLLTPRVSWSDIVSHSQETLVDDVPRSPPRTPIFRGLAPPSPPERLPMRRRPPSVDRSGRLGKRDQNEGRFARDFSEVTRIGKGQFSTVYRARNVVDHCMYAVKKTNQLSRGVGPQSQFREVLALASVAIEAEGCPHIVRYFSSWLEEGRLHIQTELCEMSLRDRLTQFAQESKKTGGKSDPRMEPHELSRVLLHVSKGLTVLHKRNYVHLDIKPDNILVARGCYKIADLGLAAAAMGSGCDDVSEGDCRYLAREVLQGDLSNLPKADVFALGLVCYELATNPHQLPMHGDEWQQLRNGVLNEAKLSPAIPGELLALIRAMIREPAADRPPCDEIAGHRSVAPPDGYQALQEKMKQTTLEAEQAKQRADDYWREMMAMKRQELLGGGPPSPSTVVLDSDGLRLGSPVPMMHRTRTM